MNPERWQQVKNVFDQAVELAPSQRIAFLDRACSSDGSLRREVESLLSSGEEACSGFLEPCSTCATSREGTRLGIYEIQSLLGSGGMGVVYRAIRADGQYKQQVALKIVRADLGEGFASARFRNERQILASLDHPNIAKILDAGTTPDGLPYFVMEFIDGLPITTATDVYSLGLVLYGLLTGRRAYQITSRMPHDIARAVLETEPEKPSTAIQRKEAASDGQPERAPQTPEIVSSLRRDSPEKLRRRLSGDLDNIVLKALRKEPRERYNSVDQLSEDIRRYLARLPVLARKSTVTYRSRKYVLRHKVGAAVAALVFLSLLTGIALTLREARIAHANELRAERRLQQTRELTDSLIAELPAAIGNGVTPAKALMNQKAIQYLQQITQEESRDPMLMFGLAHAYLRLGEVQGDPGLGNLGDTGSALDNYQRAINLFEKQLAADQTNVRIRLFLAHAYSVEGLALGWTNVQTGLEMQLKALAMLPPESDPPDYLVELERFQQNELVGEQYGDPYFPNLGDTSHALEYVQKAIVLGERLYRKTNPETHDTLQLYYSNIQMAGILWARGDTKEALQYQSRGEALLTSTMSPSGLLGDDFVRNWAPNSQQVREERAMAMIRRANLLAHAGRLRDAQAALHESRGMLESLFWTDPMNAALRRDLTRDYNLTGNLLTRTGNPQASLEMYRKASPLTTELLQAQPNQPDVQQHLADTYQGMGDTLAAMGRTSEALQNSRNALAIRESLAKLDPNDARYKFSLAKNYVSFGNVLAKAHRRADAISNYRLAVGIEKSLAAGDPFNALVARDLADTKRKLHALNPSGAT